MYKPAKTETIAISKAAAMIRVAKDAHTLNSVLE